MVFLRFEHAMPGMYAQSRLIYSRNAKCWWNQKSRSYCFEFRDVECALEF